MQFENSGENGAEVVDVNLDGKTVKEFEVDLIKGERPMLMFYLLKVNHLAMKLSELEISKKLNTQAFPYPVLTSDFGDAADYSDSDFQCSLKFDEEISDSQKFDINYNFQLSNDAILNLIENGSANFSIHYIVQIP